MLILCRIILLLSAWDRQVESFILDELTKIDLDSFSVVVDGLDIMRGKENSYVLYFRVKMNQDLKLLQEKIYHILPVEKYHPQSFKMHITITIDKDYGKIMRMRRELEKGFVPFELQVNSIGLFEIYPASLLKVINCRE